MRQRRSTRPLALGRAGLEIADAEIGEHAAEVGGILVALQLLREAPVGVVADENIDPIAIDAQGQAVLGEQLLEDDGVPVQVLGGAEVQGQHGAGGVIDRAQQGHRGAAPLEPIKGTAVDLDELAEARFGRAPLAMLLGAPPVLGGQAQSAPPLADRFATDAEALLLEQLLGGVAVVEALVAGLQQRVDLRADAARQAGRRGPVATAVQQAHGPLGLEAYFQPLHLSDAQAQGGGPLRVRRLAREQRLQQPGPRHFLSAHREGLRAPG